MRFSIFGYFQTRKTGMSILRKQLKSFSFLWNLRKIDEIWASSLCIYYGRHLDPNTKPFSTRYNDDVDIANKNLLTFLSLEYATNPENMGFQTQISHFQRSKTGMSILRKQLQSFSSLWNLRKIHKMWASSPAMILWKTSRSNYKGVFNST